MRGSAALWLMTVIAVLVIASIAILFGPMLMELARHLPEVLRAGMGA